MRKGGSERLKERGEREMQRDCVRERYNGIRESDTERKRNREKDRERGGEE